MFKKYVISIKVIILLIIFFNSLYAQHKYEKESHLSEKNVPRKALNFLDSLDVSSNIRWYLEEGLDSRSIEAKFKYNNLRHSVEFDTIGNLQDIEVETEWSDLTNSLKVALTTHLSKDCEKFKIRKVQIQYTGDTSVLLAKIKTGESSKNYFVSYEIVVKCKKSKNIDLYEYLFSDSGEKLSTARIVFKNSSNLEY
ncbi:hypothetical protein [Chondrinema litorale]|uniref:hypothetical protein n=1 Tax=Chondrinema litorale TaxID=2994555 RepID=UPI00254362FC|nr:hypothetical protein [Chondrinema litorale]UZR99601.1 hypothetical protein OQ292_37060 [Chondrinema litorale]